MKPKDATNRIKIKQQDDVVNQFIENGIFISTRRKLRSSCLLSKAHPESWKYFKSHASRRLERMKHLTYHPLMIHPFSKLNLYWEFFMLLVMFLQFLLIPLNASLMGIPYARIYWTRFTLDMCQLADIIKIYFTGYYNEHQNETVLACCKVAKKYVTTYFFIDIISSLYCYTVPLRRSGVMKIDMSVALWWRFLNRLKVFRFPRLLSGMELFRRFKGYSSYKYKFFKVIVTFIFIIMWSFSIDFFLEYMYILVIKGRNLTFVDPVKEIVQKYYNTAIMLVMAGHGKEEIISVLEYVTRVFFICFGFVLQICLLAQLLHVWSKYSSTHDKHQSLFQQVREYSKCNKLPLSLREKMFSYFQFKFYKQFFQESDITDMVSPILKKEILSYITTTHVGRVDFFKTLPESFLLKMVALLKSEIYLPGDVIIKADDPGTSMFFVYHGTVAVFASNGKEICHLEDGTHFGEVDLIITNNRVVTVVAVTTSELFKLMREDFLSVIEPYPELMNNLTKAAADRLQDLIDISHSET